MQIAYAGAQGAFAHQAAQALFGGSPMETRFIACPSFAAALDVAAHAALLSATKAAVVPVYNSSAGLVPGVIAQVIQRQLYITHALQLRVRLALLGVPGARIEDVKRAHSHPMALLQCAAFLKRHHIAPEPGTNTALCAQEVASRGERSQAAVGSVDAAASAGLVVLDDGVEDAEENTTLFLAVSRVANPIPSPEPRVSAWAVPTACAADLDLDLDLANGPLPAMAVENTRTVIFVPGDVKAAPELREGIRFGSVAGRVQFLGTFSAPRLHDPLNALSSTAS